MRLGERAPGEGFAQPSPAAFKANVNQNSGHGSPWMASAEHAFAACFFTEHCYSETQSVFPGSTSPDAIVTQHSKALGPWNYIARAHTSSSDIYLLPWGFFPAVLTCSLKVLACFIMCRFAGDVAASSQQSWALCFPRGSSLFSFLGTIQSH